MAWIMPLLFNSIGIIVLLWGYSIVYPESKIGKKLRQFRCKNHIYQNISQTSDYINSYGIITEIDVYDIQTCRLCGKTKKVFNQSASDAAFHEHIISERNNRTSRHRSPILRPTEVHLETEVIEGQNFSPAVNKFLNEFMEEHKSEEIKVPKKLKKVKEDIEEDLIDQFRSY